ncbi:MAG: hypothetical protein H6818_21775 [Phycisphaerales bacterium]|nr:hypothetical protein [Phycisphaerales bacterium]MCB9862421.1 hypothetical protein [Phycisphaerales bacterium]
MDTPATPPNESNIDIWRDYAMAFVREHFGETAPAMLGDHRLFPMSPLDGDGATLVVRFEADRSGSGSLPYYVVVGQTEANYYDGGKLDFDEAFSLHLGTRFMLVLGVAQVKDEPENLAPDDKPYDIERDARLIVNRVAPDASIRDVSLAALFNVDGERHAVIRARVADQDVYIMGRDAPLGFSRRTDLPAPMAYRLHIGAVLRKEPNPETA